MTDHVLTTQQETIANKLAGTLDDVRNLPCYRDLAGTYSERHLLDMLDRAREVPDHRIKKSRSALFVWLVRHEKDYGDI